MRKLFIILAAPALLLSAAACEVRKTEEGEAPDVDVKGGKMPEYDVHAPDIQVRKKKVEVTVPDIKVIPRRDEPAAEPPTRDRDMERPSDYGDEPVRRMSPTTTATPKTTPRK